MPKINRITQEGKKAIANLLNTALQIEYGVILNYPRIIDQLVNIDKATDKNLINNLERLGKDSFRHSAVVSKLIEELGGKVEWEMAAIDRLIDISSMLSEQLEKERVAMSIYEDAKHIAQKNQAKSRGFWGKMFLRRMEIRNDIMRSKVIDILTKLQYEEREHIKLVEVTLSQIGTTPEK
ncbi:ferritin-like domain-containing protein [Chloroflexota bacterium]